MRKYTTSFLLAFAVLLTACGNSSNPTRDPAPTAEVKQQKAETLIATTPYGQPFELDGCTVRMHQVYATHPGMLGKNQFMMATAACPTAKVTATQTSCGRDCKQSSLKIESGVSASSAEPTVAQQKAELKKQINELEDARALAGMQLEALEQSLPD